MLKIDFNPDGSIKLPKRIIKEREDDDKIFRDEPSIRVTRNQISSITPLKCELTIEASNKLINPKRIKLIYNSASGKFKHMSQLSIQKIHNRKYVVRIISGRFRCSWCNNFRRYLKKEMNVKIINYGSCFDYTSSRKY